MLPRASSPDERTPAIQTAPLTRRALIRSLALTASGLACANSSAAEQPAASLAAAKPNPPASSVERPSPSWDDGADGVLPRAHPFWPFPRLTLVTDHRKHRSRGSGLVILKDRWLFFWREASIHGASDPDSLVRMGESRNGGQTIENIRTIYREDHGITGTDIRARLMGHGYPCP